MIFHFHRDPDWQMCGNYRLDCCRCGARRIRRFPSRMEQVAGLEHWHHLLVDRHGVRHNDSGWVRQ